MWSALALALWLAVLTTGLALPTRFDVLSWHIHAMLFGMVPAAIAGFLLTAIPNWTGRPPVRGAALVALVVLWLLGRVACLLSAWMPYWLAAIVDLAFPVLLCALTTHEIVAARNWRNLAMPVPIAVLTLADLLVYLGNAGFDLPVGLGWRLALVAVIALITAIGGRIIPAFTRNWLLSRGASPLPGDHSPVDRAALATLHAALLAWVFLPTFRPLGGLLLAAALLNLWRLARWRGFATLPEPMLAILHLGYAWVVAGAALLGTAMLYGTVPTSAAIHALTAGAIGTMLLAVFTRVSRGHSGRPLTADRATRLIYSLITAAAVVRVTAPFTGALFMPLLGASALLWVASFALFAAAYGPMLVAPRVPERRTS